MRERIRQFRELSRLFFGRFVDNDLISLDGDTKGTVLGVLGLMVAPGLFVPLIEFVMYSSVPLCDQPWWARDLVAAADKVLHIGLSMTVLGVVTVLEWEALLLDRRDYAVLKPLPVGMGTLLGAKVWALGKFWLLFTVLLNGASMVLFPAAVLQKGSMDLLVWYIRCHAMAILAGNAFIFLAMVAVQGGLLNLLGWRGYRRWAPYAQSMLIAALVAMLFLSLGVSLDVDPEQGAYGVLRYLPPVWFMGLYENQLGWAQRGFRELAGQAWGGLALAAATGRGCICCQLPAQRAGRIRTGRGTRHRAWAAESVVVGDGRPVAAAEYGRESGVPLRLRHTDTQQEPSGLGGRLRRRWPGDRVPELRRNDGERRPDVVGKSFRTAIAGAARIGVVRIGRNALCLFGAGGAEGKLDISNGRGAGWRGMPARCAEGGGGDWHPAAV